MIDLMDERRKYKNQSTNEAKKEYRRLNNKLRRETDKAKVNWWQRQCEELEELSRTGKQEQIYRRIKNLGQRKSSGCTMIKDKDGTLLCEQQQVTRRWKDYIEELYAAMDKPSELDMEPMDQVTVDNIGPIIIKEEVSAAIKDMKNNKAEGVDGIPAEMLKSLGDRAVQVFTSLCQNIYNKGEWPDDFLESIIITIKKKPNATECGDFRTISLLGHAAKVVLKILTKRIEAKVETIGHIGEDQYGFRRGVGTRDAIAVLRTLGERSIQHGRTVNICFVDYEKAFDRVDWKKLMNALKRLGVDWKDRNLITNLYLNQSAYVRVSDEISEKAAIGRGVRQGCPLSPLLFNIYIEELVREAMEKTEEGIKVGGAVVKAIRFADDQAMVAETQKGLQEIMYMLNETSKDYNMKINMKKTKVMRISREEGGKLSILIDGHKLEQVEQFVYLGSMITEDGRCNKEIKRRIALGKEAYNRRKELFGSKWNLILKKRLVKVLVWSVALFGSETWTLRKDDIRRLEAFEMWLWRRMMKISWTQHVTNEEVLSMVEEHRSLIATIRKAHTKWMGHILRHDSLLKKVIEGRLWGKKTPGRPRAMMLDWLLKQKTGEASDYAKLKQAAEERDKWRH